jgi:hypothetical protein
MKLVKTPKMTSTVRLITDGQSIIDKMTATTSYFSGATALLTAAQTALDSLRAAAATAEYGSPADTQAMYLARNTFKTKLMVLVLYVDVVAITNPTEAGDIIACAGLNQKKTPTINIQTLKVKNGTTSGSVIVRSKAKRGHSYLFQESSDIASTSGWTTVSVATSAAILLTGRTPVKTYWYRVALIKGNVQQPFTDPVSIVVL